LKEKENSNVPNKGLGIKVGTVIGHIEAGHGIEIVALEIAERERTGQIWRHSHGIKALHGAVVEFKRRRSGEQGKERLRGGGGGGERNMECVADAPTDSGKSGAAVFAENEDGFYIYSVWIILSPFPSPLLLL
jgi:hypothetical protein